MQVVSIAPPETIRIPTATAPKPVTLIYPFYDNADFLARQITQWHALPVGLKKNLSLIVVDDGSPDAPAAPILRANKPPFPWRLFRIEVDVRWNWLAARNIGFHHAPEGWCLVTDMDHIVPRETMEAVIWGAHDPACIYRFSRRGAKQHPHPNSWFFTREMYWRVGGYDETLSGHYGTDGEYRRRCAATAPVHILRDELVCHEHEGDASTVRYLRKQPEDARVKKLIRARGPEWKPRVLSFPYHEVPL